VKQPGPNNRPLGQRVDPQSDAVLKITFAGLVSCSVENKLPQRPLPDRPNCLERAILNIADSATHPLHPPLSAILGRPKCWVTVPIFVGCPDGGSPDAKGTNSNADGFFLWPLQHARRASGSSEWLGRRLGGEGDLAARNDLLPASLSSSSLSSLSSLSLVIGFSVEVSPSPQAAGAYPGLPVEGKFGT
jgi:hypothetical protein